MPDQDKNPTAEAILALANVFERFYQDEDNQTIVDAVLSIGRAIDRLGNADAATPMGAIEALGKAIHDGSERIAQSLDGLAEAIRESNG